MKICHVCNAECNDDAEICLICGADLSEKQSTEESTEASDENTIANPVLLATFEDFISAEIFMDILNEKGIFFTYDEPAIKITFGGSLVASNIFVDDSDFEAAKLLYDEFIQSQKESD